MLDQSFSAKNFRAILDLENRKGVHVEDQLSISEIRKINEEIRDCNASIKEKRKDGNETEVNRLYEFKKELRAKKEIELEKELEKISQRVSEKDFQIRLTKVDIPGDKPIYTTPKTPEHFFALKQIQRNISKLFNVKQANRFNIVSQVKVLLDDQFPKYVIRTDIKDFYESIHHDLLLKKINKNNLLTPFSRSILRRVLYTYTKESGSKKGVPRGIGASAYLAELFMQDIDSEIKGLKGVSYYARYVDDIIAIFTPTPTEQKRDYLKEVKAIVESNKYKLKLSPESDKTRKFDLTSEQSPCQLEYLGYKFFFGDGPVRTKLTDKKVKKYRKRLRLVFEHYVNLSKVDEKKARKLLVKRVRFLTGNTKLTNNKKNIKIGIFYSNSQLTELKDLKSLDKSLTRYISTKITSSPLQNRLKKYNFRKGFEEKRFSPFKPNELSEIMDAWSNTK